MNCADGREDMPGMSSPACLFKGLLTWIRKFFRANLLAAELKDEERLRLPRPRLKNFSCPFADRVRSGVPLRHAGGEPQ